MMNSAAYRFLTLIAVLSLVSIGTLHGQTAVTGGITGYVSDTSGAAVSGATVVATNTATAVSDQTATNKDGLYLFSSLIPGTYTIAIKKDGFAPFERVAIRVDAGTGVRIDAKLPVGTVKTAVTVTSQAPLLQTDSVDISDTIRSAEINALPTFGNNITRLSLLAPGAFMQGGQLDLHPENAGEDFNVNINGAQPNNNSHLLDGVDNSEAIQGYSLLVASQDSVQEVKLTTSNYDAEYGHVNGGVWQVTTKSGTNQLHGSAFEYYRSAGFFAADQFSQPNGVPGNVWNQFGGSVGGPIIKDKLFFFGDYQGMRNHLFTSSLYTAPIDAFKSGDFSSVAATNPIYDPATGNPDGSGRTQFSCNGVLNKICPDRFSPATVNLLALLPEAKNQNSPNNNYTNSLPAIFGQNQFNTRVDYFATPKTVVFGKFSYFRANFYTNNVFGAVAGGPPLGGAVNSGNSLDNDYQAMGDYQHTFSLSLLTDVRFAFSKINISELQLDSNLDTATTVGIPDINLGTVYTSGLPQLTVQGPTGGFTMGDLGLPFFEKETEYQIYNNWTKTYRRHTFKFGADIERFNGVRTDVSGRGAFDFSSNLTGNPAVANSGLGMASFLLGLSDNFGRDITLVQPTEKQKKWAFYGQDTWRVNPKLTLILGLRWDYLSPIYTPNGQSVGNVDLNTGNVLLTNLAGKYAGVTTSKTEFSPRLGLSYQLLPNTVVRGGYGRSYFQNPYGAAFGTQGCCWPIKQSQNDSGANPFAPLPYTLDQGPGVPAALPPYPANGQIPLPNGFSEYFPGTGPYPHSYSDTYNVTLEQSLPYQITFSLSYVGNHGRHLWDNVDVNAPVPGPGNFDPRRPYFARYGWTVGENQRNNQLAGYPELKSNYNSLQARVEKRFHAGFYIMSNFTWDKSLDEGTFGPQNQFNFPSNYGNSDTTRPWAWVSAFNWDLPFGRGKTYGGQWKSAEQALLGGWQISGIVNLQGGMYFTPFLANNASLNSTIGLRPDRIGSGRVSNPNRFEWFNPADFTVPAPYVYGNSGRNILLGPGFYSTDMSLAKSFAFTERVNLQLKWDTFNTFNRENLANPNPNVDTSTAGQITGIVDFRRRMQIGAHLTF
jgi:outer membrane receptor protein involved in Fe transport